MPIYMNYYFKFKKFHFLSTVIVFLLLIIFIYFFFGSRIHTRQEKLKVQINLCKGQLSALKDALDLYKEKYGKFPDKLESLEVLCNNDPLVRESFRKNLFYCPNSEQKYLYINKGDILVMDFSYCNELKILNILLKDGTIITAKKGK